MSRNRNQSRLRPATNGLMADLMNRLDDVTMVDVVDESSIDESGDLAAKILSYIDFRDTVNHEFILLMGSYTWNTEFAVLDPVEFIEIRGEPRATLEVRNHGVGIAFLFGRWATNNPSKYVILRNFDVDIDDEQEHDAGLISAHIGRCLLNNVEFVGELWRHGPLGGDRYTCLINTRDPNALSLIRNFGLPHCEIDDSSQPSVGHSIGCSADSPHERINIWDRCYVDNALYVRNSEGENFVKHSMAANCGTKTSGSAPPTRLVAARSSSTVVPTRPTPVPVSGSMAAKPSPSGSKSTAPTPRTTSSVSTVTPMADTSRISTCFAVPTSRRPRSAIRRPAVRTTEGYSSRTSTSRTSRPPGAVAFGYDDPTSRSGTERSTPRTERR